MHDWLTPADHRRRKVGLILLIFAGALTAAGISWLDPYLIGVRFVFYWLVCWALTSAAMITAIWDMRVVGRRIRRDSSPRQFPRRH